MKKYMTRSFFLLLQFLTLASAFVELIAFGDNALDD